MDLRTRSCSSNPFLQSTRCNWCGCMHPASPVPPPHLFAGVSAYCCASVAGCALQLASPLWPPLPRLAPLPLQSCGTPPHHGPPLIWLPHRPTSHVHAVTAPSTVALPHRHHRPTMGMPQLWTLLTAPAPPLPPLPRPTPTGHHPAPLRLIQPWSLRPSKTTGHPPLMTSQRRLQFLNSVLSVPTAGEQAYCGIQQEGEAASCLYATYR